MDLIFATGNYDKFFTAHHVLEKYNINLIQTEVTADEIQSEDSLAILKDKIQKAYQIVGKPLLVSDDGWEIPGLNGFPGPYMKSINSWFTVDDFLRLTSTLKDRRIFLIQNVAYKDDKQELYFKKAIEGTLLKEARGNDKNANARTISLTSDGRSLAEVFEHDRESLSNLANVWDEVGAALAGLK